MELDYSKWTSQQQNEEPYNKRRLTCNMGGLFSVAQWQELELQALIYKYIMAGSSVPLELILHLKSAPLCSSPYYYHYQPSMMQTGYWGRCLADPEPGRCRRTDGKKWRCSRDVVAGQKYCERHVHRGRNRSRKHVEIPTPSPSSSTSTPFNQRPQEAASNESSKVLMRFFDDWPRTQQERRGGDNNVVSDTQLSISIPESSSSDFSLKLSTGNVDDIGVNIGREQPILGSWLGWGNHGEASMGGPLAEALRLSTTTPSPTSILHKPNASVSESSSTTT